MRFGEYIYYDTEKGSNPIIIKPINVMGKHVRIKLSGNEKKINCAPPPHKKIST